MQSREAALVDAGTGGMKHLRAHHDFLAARELAQRAAENRFAFAVGVVVRGVEEVDAELERASDDRPAARLVQHPRLPTGIAEAEGAEADARDLEPAAPEARELHSL